MRCNIILITKEAPIKISKAMYNNEVNSWYCDDWSRRLLQAGRKTYIIVVRQEFFRF